MKTIRVLKETFFSTIPLAVVIIVVCGFIAPMESAFDYFKLAVGYASVVLGQTLFLVGLDSSILPIGTDMDDGIMGMVMCMDASLAGTKAMEVFDGGYDVWQKEKSKK